MAGCTLPWSDDVYVYGVIMNTLAIAEQIIALSTLSGRFRLNVASCWIPIIEIQFSLVTINNFITYLLIEQVLSTKSDL